MEFKNHGMIIYRGYLLINGNIFIFKLKRLTPENTKLNHS